MDVVGGPENPRDLAALLESHPRITKRDGFVCFRGQEELIERSRPRVIVNGSTNGNAAAIALQFTNQLLKACPLVDCVALSGSAASGGYIPSDDVDLDIFVRDGAKYLTYAIALALGFLVSIRFRRGGRLRKIICINVIWTRGQTKPFVRRDEALAFELLHCRPIFGAFYFRQVISSNPWILGLFPQLEGRLNTDQASPEISFVGRIVGWIGRHPHLLELSDRLGRSLSRVVYDLAHWRRRKDVGAMERLAFLRQVKFPYEFFQD